MTLDEHLRRSRILRRLRAGPFREGIDHYTERLRNDGYGPHHGGRAISLVFRFTRWLTDRHFGFHDIDEHLVGRFLAARTRQHPLRAGDRSALRRLVAVLREAEIIGPELPAKRDPREQILESFREYLEARRGLLPASSKNYIWFIQRFLHDLSITRTADLASLSQDDIVGYVERHASDGSAITAKLMCSRLRSFLTYLQVEGVIGHELAACIPSIRTWSLTRLPTYLSAAQLQQIYRSCDRDTAVGRRDYAVLMLLGGLGLRANEIATLTLDDIDWRAGQFRIQGKGRQPATMPLPPDIGAALVAYLRNGRPASASRRVFLRARPPHSGFPTSSGITNIAGRALARAVVTGAIHRGAHVFRHTLATELLRSGASLTEIGQVLRHQDHDTTRIYAKVDLASLRTLSLPWPGGGL
ncbi:site-specific integrase [Sphingomonas sp. MG17]|uniref:Site-specific integrase n=1 Tax=Sphingomonas tagetis TaxID=2949092 RepID=A0A9X2KN30_9SPHN|nr:site-specific integrase [Sphingomonas tagetis]MCP3733239.1 site-specific integrase [Sphingomonas tagetis]